MEDDSLDLSSIPREIDPPPGLDRRIAGTLRRERLLRHPRIMWYAVAAAILIAAFLFYRPAPVAKAQYILLLYESPQFTGGNREEYGKWARTMQPAIVGGEELNMTDVVALPGAVTPLPRDASRLAGYFLINAPDDAHAAAVARACPHLRHGGAVVLRKIM